MPIECWWKRISELELQTDQPAKFHFSSVSVLNLQAGWTYSLMQYGHSYINPSIELISLL